jgi:predicted O-linked N-acetylglucosamine transferase (SPINDLY family)
VPRQSPEDFMGLQNVADVILDTPHFSGGNTSFEAFALGKPVVTHDGAFMRGRVTSGMYRMMGMDDCISDNLEDYINIALKLGKNISYRREIALKIQESRDVLFNNVSVVSEFEEFFKISITKILSSYKS